MWRASDRCVALRAKALQSAVARHPSTRASALDIASTGPSSCALPGLWGSGPASASSSCPSAGSRLCSPRPMHTTRTIPPSYQPLRGMSRPPGSAPSREFPWGTQSMQSTKYPPGQCAKKQESPGSAALPATRSPAQGPAAASCPAQRRVPPRTAGQLLACPSCRPLRGHPWPLLAPPAGLQGPPSGTPPGAAQPGSTRAAEGTFSLGASLRGRPWVERGAPSCSCSLHSAHTPSRFWSPLLGTPEQPASGSTCAPSPSLPGDSPCAGSPPPDAPTQRRQAPLGARDCGAAPPLLCAWPSHWRRPRPVRPHPHELRLHSRTAGQDRGTGGLRGATRRHTQMTRHHKQSTQRTDPPLPF